MTATKWHARAMVLLERGDFQEARNLLAMALNAEPQNAQYMLDYAQVYVELGQYAKAESFFGSALELDSNSAVGNFRWGNLRKQLGHVTEAVEKYSLAIAAKPDYVEAFNNRGGAYDIMGKSQEARDDYMKAIELNPRLEEAYLNLGRLLDMEGDIYGAARTYERALAYGVNPDLFTHLVHSASGGTSFRAPLGYVRTIFDGYASAFDMHLTQQMRYVLPAQIGAQVRGIAAQRTGDKLIAVDLGCGTGLCGAEIVASVSHLAGVDASPAMLDQADRRGIYHDLVEGDIEHYLAGLADASVDILAAGDALPFFGLLDNIIRAAARVLRPEGAFVFSIETLEGTADYQLHHSGRFRHSVQYIEKLAARFDKSPDPAASFSIYCTECRNRPE